MATPKLRFKEFDGEWSVQNLGDSFSLISGYAFPSSASVDSGVRWLKIADVGIQEMTPNNPSYLPLEYLSKYSQFIVNKNDYVIALTRPILNKKLKVAKVGDFYDGALLNQRVAKIASTKNDLDFIYSLLQKSKTVEELENSIAGTDPPNLSLNDVKEIKLGFPSKEEQTKIASFLSVVDEKISQLTQKHELLSQYKQGMMQKLFSQQIRFKADDGSKFREWEETKFLNLMEDLWDYRGRTPKKLGMDWGNGEIQSLSALNIKKGFIDFEADCHLGSEELYKVWMNKGDLVKDDIIFTMEAPLGNVALIPDDRKYILSQRVVCFKTNKELVFNPFLFQLILSDQFQNRIDELATGTTAKGINQKSMQKIEVKIPCLEEQTKIANFLSAIDQKIEVVAQQIEQAKQWKKGLLQQMFV